MKSKLIAFLSILLVELFVLTPLAAPSLTELCVRVTYALATNQGIYIKPVASYPPLEFGYY